MFPEDLHARLHTVQFWTDYFHLTEPDCPTTRDLEWEVTFDLDASVQLELVISYGVSATTLLIRETRNAGAPIVIAWDDQAHWHPHVFRWPELQSVCRRIGARSEHPHPGLPLLLLYRFAPLTSEAEFQHHSPEIHNAWDNLGLFTSEQIFSFVDRVDFRGQGVQWYQDHTLGWTIQQVDRSAERDIYSVRVRGNTDFPFGLWNALMSELSEEST